MLERVTIEQLRTLRAVAREGSFSAAARKLGRVQAAVSQAIERLESQLGLRLFDRSSRVPRLTKHGEAIVGAAEKIDHQVEELDALVAMLKLGTETTMSIVVDAMFPAAALVAFAQEFSARHPSVELVLFSEAMSAVTAHVRDKRAMMGIAGDDADLTDLVRRHVTTIKLVPVAAPSHPLAAIKGSIDAGSLSRAVQIVLSERAGAEVQPSRAARTSRELGVLSPRTWRVVDLASKHALIAGGLGWGQLPAHLVRDDLDRGRLVALRLDAWGDALPQRSLMLVRRRGTSTGPVAQWVEARISELCRGVVEP